ncbi:MAG: T9SS type A sorting domain-containing protein [Flavobacteriaceae bacterium]|nr:T9SS type A sorting domain-containing protein [Flavobacteriaceae bacterium]
MKKSNLLILVPLLIFLNNISAQITLPVEVLGAEGTIEEREFTLTAAQVTNSKVLWLQVNNLGYQNKASIKINAGSWLTLNHSTTKIQSPEKERGGMSNGGYNTIRFTIPVTGLTTGLNTIYFRFNMSDAISNGYRVVKFNLHDINNNKILNNTFFVNEDPMTWVGPYTDSGSIAAGKDLWYNAPLISSSLPSTQSGFWYGYDLGTPKPIKAKCTSCHVHDGRDLEIFSYSNKAIIERSKFHNLTEEEGKLIASYIRSLSEEHENVDRYGRPWNPPYQPGPSLADKPIEQWAAGAGLDAVLEKDEEMLAYMFPNGVTQDEVYNRFDSDNMVDRTLLPLAIQFPDWKHWLPIVHPMDAYTGDAGYTGAISGTSYWDNPVDLGVGDIVNIDPRQGYLDYRAYLEAMPPANRPPNELMKKNRDMYWHYRFFLRVNELPGGSGPGAGGQHWRQPDGTATDQLDPLVPRELAATSLARLMAVQYFEIMNEFDLQDKAHWFAPPEDQPASRQWFGQYSQVFEIPAHFQAGVTQEERDYGIPIPGKELNFYGQSTAAGVYESTNWYNVQSIVNGGNGMLTQVSPVDYNYTPDLIRWAGRTSGIYEPLRFYHHINVMNQTRTWSRATSPNLQEAFRIRLQGPWWNLERSPTSLSINELEPGLSVWTYNALLKEFIDAVNLPENDLSGWDRLPNGSSNALDAISKTNADLIPGYVGQNRYADKLYDRIPKFIELGIDCQLIESLIDWCEAAWPNITWNVFRNNGELKLNLALDADDECAINTNTITAITTNEGSNPIYEWWIDGNLNNTTTNELDVSNIQSGAIIKCKVTSNSTCIANTWAETELTLPGNDYTVMVSKNSSDWQEFTNSIACLNDTLELKIVPNLQEPLIWLDAMDINNTGVIPSNGSAITRWHNKATSDYALPNQADVTLRPKYSSTGMNGLPAVMFGMDDNKDGFELFPAGNNDTLNGDWTMFITASHINRDGVAWNYVVGNRNLPNGPGVSFSTNSSGNPMLRNNEIADYGDGLSRGWSNKIKDNESYLLMIKKDGNIITTYLNGRLEHTAEASSSDISNNSFSFYLGRVTSLYFHKGPMSEVLFYDYNVSNTQKEYIEGYLMHKWNFDSKLTNNHLYRENSPLYVNLQTPNNILVFDKNTATNTMVLNSTNKFGNYNFTKPNCTLANTKIIISNGNDLNSGLVKYSINNTAFVVGHDFLASTSDTLELAANFTPNNFQWEEPNGNLLPLNINPPIFSLTTACSNQEIWKLHVLQDASLCITNNYVIPVTINRIDTQTDCNFNTDILLYPNPTKDVITLDLGELRRVKITINDVLGKTMYINKNTGQTMQISMKGFATGVYFLNIQKIDNEQVSLFKIIKID